LAQVRLIRWVTEPVPGLRWVGGTDERTVGRTRPTETESIVARNDIRSGAERVTLTGMRLPRHRRLARRRPRPHHFARRTTGTPTPEFALVQLDIIERPPAP